MCKLTNPEPRTLSHLFHPALTPQEAIFLCPDHPRAKYQIIRDRPYAPEPAKLCKLANSKPADPALPFPMETTIRAPAHVFPCSFWLLTNPGASPWGPVWHGTFPVSRDL